MLIERRFVWGDGRPDEFDEIHADTIDRHLTRAGARFRLRTWDLRYRPGRRRLTEAVYDEVLDAVESGATPT